MNEIKLTLINSSKYFRLKILGYILSVLAMVLGGLIAGRGTGGNFFSLFFDIPLWMEIIFIVFFVVLLISGISLQFNKEANKGDLLLSEQVLKIRDEEYVLQDFLTTVFVNQSSDKNIYKRTIKDQGGNNWVEFDDNGVLRKYEFLLDSQKQEDELKGLIKSLQDNGLNIVLKKSPRSLKDKWGEF